MISLFGKGFIGSKFTELYQNSVYVEPRESLVPTYNDILYLRGTNSNYNIFEDPSKDIRDNLLLFTDTLKNLTPNNDILLTSSWFTYHPKGFYSISKLAQEQFLESYAKTFNIKYKIVRLSNVFGKDPRASGKKNALEFLISKIKNNEGINLYEGDNYRNFLDVKTCCEAIKWVMDFGQNGETYDIGASESYKIGDLLKYCIIKTGSLSKIKVIETPDFHKLVQVKDFWMNTDKLKSLGFDNNIDIYKELDKIL